MSLEGIILKRPDAPYVSARTRDLAQAQVRAAPGVRHLRLHRPQQRRARGRRPAAGHLREAASCVYAGNVGTGWNSRTGARAARAPGRARDEDADARRRLGQARALVAAHGGRRALGPARAGGRGRVPRVDARRPHPPRRLRGAARRQAGDGGHARGRAGAGRCRGDGADDAEHQGHEPRPRHRPVDRPDQGRRWCATTKASPSGCCRT